MSISEIVRWLEYAVWTWPAIGGEISLIVIALLGVGVFLTLRLVFIQVRHLGHGTAVTMGKYDDPNEPGDVSHFQALSTAMSATVGVGNIAGVAVAIHWGGPGAIFWMWVVAFLGMAIKYSEVTLALHYRDIEEVTDASKAWEGTVSGGPMYYIEKGLGRHWKPLAIFFAAALMCTSLVTGNAVQSNTVSQTMLAYFSIPVWVTGMITATLVGLVIIGGITRIGRVSGIMMPFCALFYGIGALIIIFYNITEVPAALALIVTEAFNPTAGVAGTGAGVFLMTMMHGVRRGLFSNEAGQGSAPIAHSAAKTDEPVSEGSVALLEPFIDTFIICTMTALVIILTGVWNDTFETTIPLAADEVTYVSQDERGVYRAILGLQQRPDVITVDGGIPNYTEAGSELAWQNAPVPQLWVDPQREIPFTGRLLPLQNAAVDLDGNRYTTLYGNGARTGAVLTINGFERGLEPLGLAWLGRLIVVLSVFLFATTTAISWSYYGDRCANYLFGKKGVLPYKAAFVLMHFVGAIAALELIWIIGDVLLGMVAFPNLLALVLLSGVVAKLTKSYFDRKPWLENAEVHKRVVEERKQQKKNR